jgi:hypothetical protein
VNVPIVIGETIDLTIAVFDDDEQSFPARLRTR